ncbi:cornifin-A-like [Canis lupus familiaris]|uniref:Uncharacterized protein n=1 Tax=Canis lupus familiaris TaxID=9615 RepID=A0A8I3PPT2_CANLF|nr:cornifin-A-like [Canis lupus familiaris]
MSSHQQKQLCIPLTQPQQQQEKQRCQPPPQELCAPKSKEPCYPKVPEPCHAKDRKPCLLKVPEPCPSIVTLVPSQAEVMKFTVKQALGEPTTRC